MRQKIIDAVLETIARESQICDGISVEGRTLPWLGSVCVLTTTQSSVVTLLVEAFESGSPEVPIETLQDRTQCRRVLGVFRERTPTCRGKNACAKHGR